ncbi:MAG TPA: DUF2997 domain-containing protein [Longimicrobium sp.]|jgi:hypothetical protein|uniref:DUF2997 domain-containing protein n=1 Tax=Longimicrobium sp. TaxID=2029185 RepID=UPI002ED8F8A6
MSEAFTVRIFPDGTVQAEVHGARGKRCTDYIAILEELLEAETADSAYTAEYQQAEHVRADDVHADDVRADEVRRRQVRGG